MGIVFTPGAGASVSGQGGPVKVGGAGAVVVVEELGVDVDGEAVGEGATRWFVPTIAIPIPIAMRTASVNFTKPRTPQSGSADQLIREPRRSGSVQTVASSTCSQHEHVRLQHWMTAFGMPSPRCAAGGGSL